MRPLFALRSERIDAEEKHLHSLLARNLDKLDRITLGEIEIQFAQIGTNFQRTHEEAIDRDSQFLGFVFVCLAQTTLKLLRQIARAAAG